jgi:AbrB family looped-hinge helix DNA binding protein
MSSASVVSGKGQVTLPKGLRDQLGIRPGSRLEFQVADDRTLRVRVLPAGSEALLGLLARQGEAPVSLERMNEAVSEIVKARAGRAK